MMNIFKISSDIIDRYKIVWEQRNKTDIIKIPVLKFSSNPFNPTAKLISEDGHVLQPINTDCWNPVYDYENKQFIIDLGVDDYLFCGIIELEFDIIIKVKL